MPGGSSSGDKYPGRRERKKVEGLLEFLNEDEEWAREMFCANYITNRKYYKQVTRSFTQYGEELLQYGINWSEISSSVKELGAGKVAENLMPIQRQDKQTKAKKPQRQRKRNNRIVTGEKSEIV